ncbi:hypothetical protein ISF_04455 [Cordyceps fumosorosea ARSEF 2679]|uniref:Protein kinase-like domain protein n=1 Tax=Cordyceps fumosorosea (strain ARSEF 2679) TaxID=1081104 RepID=A0A167XJG5_CORFA|nr:hypothetical protein ISF_04455 [Cordyceps fumosorosea ARSEF 2679]OAA65045.1 hypothetical protein ISF_04455 [Cordyceps fumosorosea ARSEF 2679]
MAANSFTPPSSSDYYAVDTDQRVMHEPESLDMTSLQPKKIPVEHISPLWDLGLVHNDRKTGNIMFTYSDGGRFVIIDFDSYVRRGGALPIKQGHMPPSASFSNFENDDFAFQKMVKELDLAEPKDEAQKDE